MDIALIVLQNSKININSEKELPFHTLIDRSIIQHMCEELNESELDKIVFFVNNPKDYLQFKTETISFLPLKEYQTYEDADTAKKLLIKGCYPLLSKEIINELLKEKKNVKIVDREIYIKNNSMKDTFEEKTIDPLHQPHFIKVESREDIIFANEILSDIIRHYWVTKGATIMSGNIIGKDVKLGRDVVINGPCSILKESSIADNVTIKGDSYLENAKISENVTIDSSRILDSQVNAHSMIGPYAHLRMDTQIGESCRIGNYVEIKNSEIGAHTAISHLSYIGDSNIGSYVNIGCHVVTVNYDGINKNKTIIKDHTFIGSASNLIAPVSIGNNVVVAAGSTITDDIADGEMAFARSRQVNKPKLGKKYLEREK